MRRAVVVGALGLLVGCGLVPQQSPPQEANIPPPAASPTPPTIAQAYAMCVAKISEQPQYAGLVAHGVFADASQLTLGQMADTSYISPQDAHAALSAQQDIQPCRQQVETSLAANAPAFSALFVLEYEADDRNAVALITRKETWGEYDEMRQHIQALAHSDAGSIAEHLQEQALQQEAVNAQQADAQAQAASARAQQESAEAQQRETRIRFWSSLAHLGDRPQSNVSCTSSPFAGSVSTNCHSW